MSIQHLGKIQHFDIYFDPNSDNQTIYFGRKSKRPIGWCGFKNLEARFIHIPIYKSEYSTEQSHTELAQLNEEELKFEDFDFALGPFSTLTLYHKSIKLLKKSCEKI